MELVGLHTGRASCRTGPPVCNENDNSSLKSITDMRLRSISEEEDPILQIHRVLVNIYITITSRSHSKLSQDYSCEIIFSNIFGL